MQFPTWVDLKGEDSVPETVHHVFVNVDPCKDESWRNLSKRIPTDGVHSRDRLVNTSSSPGNYNQSTRFEQLQFYFLITSGAT